MAESSAPVLSRRALNRATLARQMLLERAAATPLEAIERLVGMQSQAPNPPYVGLWTRVVDFVPEQLSGLIAERRAVRIALMRSTIHLVSARDCLGLRPALQPMIERGMRTTWGRGLEGVDEGELTRRAIEALTQGPLTFAEMGRHLARFWPKNDPDSLAQATRALLPLVQVPPRGLWGRSGAARHTTAGLWLGADPADGYPASEIARRYLSAFGPASVRDVQTWSGLTGLKAVVAEMRCDLVTFRDDAGHELFDLPEAPRPGAEREAPVRFLPEWDNLFLSHVDRSRVLADEHKARLFTVNGIVASTILVDGFAAGTWSVETIKQQTTLTVAPWQRLPAGIIRELEREAHRLLAFLAPASEHSFVLLTANG